jgi:hypothetical protein
MTARVRAIISFIEKLTVPLNNLLDINILRVIYLQSRGDSQNDNKNLGLQEVRP